MCDGLWRRRHQLTLSSVETAVDRMRAVKADPLASLVADLFEAAASGEHWPQALGSDLASGPEDRRRAHDLPRHDPESMRRLAPMLARAAALSRRMAVAAAVQQVRDKILHDRGLAILLADQRGRIIHADALALRVLERDDGVRLVGGRLMTDSGDGDLQRLIVRCARRVESGSLLIARLDRAPLRVFVSGLQLDVPGLWGDAEARAVVTLTDNELAHSTRGRRLSEAYHLTSAEGAFAKEIAKGDGKAAAAARLGISYGTARSHLSNIFAKTGVRRQAELVRLLDSLL